MDMRIQGARRALVIGGSMAGLFTAALLHQQAWQVDVFERVDVELSGRGAGIVTHPELLQALDESGAGHADLGVTVRERVAIDSQGRPLDRLEFEQIVTSWDRLHGLMRATIPAGNHHLGCELVEIVQDADGVTAVFADGRTERGDVLIGADGFRSAVRRQYLPRVTPEYAGYVVWRGLVDERALAPDVHASIFDKFTFFLPPHSEVIGYPIAGLHNDLRPGHRRYNWVWYRRVKADALGEMLRGSDGTRYELTIPPPKVRQALIDGLKADARKLLPWQLNQALEPIERPFFTPIYDHCCEAMVMGRVALAGDAAAVGRPHIGMGVTKAAGDARALARLLGPADCEVAAALRRYEAERLPIARRAVERGRELGEYMNHTRETVPSDRQAAWDELHSVSGMLRHTASSAFLQAV